MRRASACFTDAQRKQIAEAVSAAESKTSAEIVPVISTCSGRYDRPEDMVGLFVGLAAMGVAWWFFPHTTPDPGSWATGIGMYELPVLVVATIAGFMVGAVAASYIYWIRHLFTPRQQMVAEVNEKARQVFFDDRVHHTAGATGMLFYVSLYERTAVILADSAVTGHLGQPALDTLCTKLIADIKKGDIAEALSNAIRAAGDQLAGVLPRAANDVNELADALILID